MRHLDLTQWIADAPDANQRRFREAVHVVITATALSPTLPDHLVMKGGILLSIAHHGDRFTRDIDFSTDGPVTALPPDTVVGEIDSHLDQAVELLEYDIDCRVQSSELRPPDPEKSWPTLIIKVGYAAYSDKRAHARLMRGSAADVVRVECSYNESMSYIDSLEISPGKALKAYSIGDVIAEKLRALIQQPIRNRYRRQDVYDICKLLDEYGEPGSVESKEVLDSLVKKAKSRNIDLDRNTLRDSDIKERAKKDYETLDAEIQGELPSFDDAYDRVKHLYETLPW